jgi:hypothetical protein
MPLVAVPPAALAILAILAAGTGAASAQTDATASSVVHLLQEGSTYQRGCFAPCLCPILTEVPVRGTFGLTFAGSDGLFSAYRVTDVNWTASLGESELRITGSGTYTIGGEFALEQRLELDLELGDGTVEHFDSRRVTGPRVPLPGIDLRVSIHGEYCADTVIRVNAAPAPLQLAVTLNQTAFRPGEIVEVELALQNLGSAFRADVYVGALLPDGMTALFLAGLSPPVGVARTLGANPATFPPLLADVAVPQGLDVRIPALSFPSTGQEPRGDYRVFAALARAGGFQDGRIDQDDLLADVVRRLTFVDIGTGQETAGVEVRPSSPTTGDAISIRLSGDWPNGCAPRDPQVRVAGSEVRIDTLGASAGVACLAVVTAWELVVPVGRLPGGTYQVVVIHSSDGRFLELARAAFDVR